MSVKCRNIKLSEDVLRRHYDMLFEVTRYFIDSLRDSQSSGVLFMLITDLYESLRISSRTGDKILDRLEQCWGYIACSRSRRYRILCIPTVVGLAALLRRPEYREKLLELYKDYPEIIDTFLNPLNLLVSSFKDESELKELLNNVRNAVTSSSGFLRTIVKISIGPHVDDKLVDNLVMFLQDLFLHESPQIPQITKVAPLLRAALDHVILAGIAYFLAVFSSILLKYLDLNTFKILKFK